MVLAGEVAGGMVGAGEVAGHRLPLVSPTVDHQANGHNRSHPQPQPY